MSCLIITLNPMTETTSSARLIQSPILMVIVAYAKVSLKKYRPIAARNDEANVSRGLL